MYHVVSITVRYGRIHIDSTAIKEAEMRVLIMSDMEGVSGIVVWDQVTGGSPMYEEGRKLYTEEINAAVRGAKRAGAEEIVVVVQGRGVSEVRGRGEGL
jgi:hypothetical protein